MNYPYNIFDQGYLTSQQLSRDYNQRKEIANAVKALDDFLNAAEKIAPEYQQMASDAICATIFERMQRRSPLY